ncbi:MAG: VWA domain-containing protein [Chloroflexota bacterium]
MSYRFDPYLILGLTPNAEDKTIQQVYNGLVAHLQANPRGAAREQLQMVHEAYQLLNDPYQRRRYDDHASKIDELTRKNSRFNLRLTPSKRSVKPLGEEQVIYVLSEIFAPHGISDQMEEREVRLNLTLVIDQSRSMDDDGRMKRVIAAAQTIITELTQDDVISIISFNDRATTIIPATPVHDVMALRARVSMIQPRGGTEIFQGLQAGINENRKHLAPEMVNHIILLTDGRTYGDEQQCLDLAQQAATEGIGISAMGLGDEWNDKFLDQLVSYSGGTSTFIKSVNMVSNFMDLQLRSLSNAFAERVNLSIVTSPDISIEMAFKISPNPQPLSVSNGVVPLAALQPKRPISVLLQLQLPAKLPDKFINIGHFVGSGDMMLNQAKRFYTASDLSVTVRSEYIDDSPPASIVDALSKLTLYRLQEKAQEALEGGDADEATRHLKYLATRLIDMGEHELGQQAMAEANHIDQTRAFSNEETKKTIKYQTRALIDPGASLQGVTALLDGD